MPEDKSQFDSVNPLSILTRFTNARIAIGRTGSSLPTKAHLEFQLAHALARDAVKIPLQFSELEQALNQQGQQCLQLQTQAENHQVYLQRPDQGRRLNQYSIEMLTETAKQNSAPDIVLTIADGLSSVAIVRHAAAFMDILTPGLQKCGYTLSPICLVKHGRVAVGDPIAEIYSADMVIVLIGERPGLSSPDSMGIYFTFKAKVGSTDAERNCISNIHRNGLSYQDALRKLLFLVNEAKRLQFSGVRLKDNTQSDSGLQDQQRQNNFLLD